MIAPWSERPGAVEAVPVLHFQKACSLADQNDSQAAPTRLGESSNALKFISAWSCQTAACVILKVMSHSISRHPAQAALHICDQYLSAVTWMLLHGGLTLHTAALQHATALMRALPAQSLPIQCMVDGLVASLRVWSQILPPEPALLQAWSAAVTDCMYQLLQAAQDGQQVAVVAPRLTSALALAIKAVSHHTELQIQLCSILVALAKLWPPALACLPALVPAAATNQGLGLQLVRCLALVPEDTAAAGDLDAAVQQGITSHTVGTAGQVCILTAWPLSDRQKAACKRCQKLRRLKHPGHLQLIARVHFHKSVQGLLICTGCQACHTVACRL